MESRDPKIQRLHLHPPPIQLGLPGPPQKRNRLPLPRMERQARPHRQLRRARGRESGRAVTAGAAGGADAGGGDDARAYVSGEGGHGEGE